jgi:hypothetical protein
MKIGMKLVPICPLSLYRCRVYRQEDASSGSGKFEGFGMGVRKKIKLHGGVGLSFNMTRCLRLWVLRIPFHLAPLYQSISRPFRAQLLFSDRTRSCSNKRIEWDEGGAKDANNSVDTNCYDHGGNTAPSFVTTRLTGEITFYLEA